MTINHLNLILRQTWLQQNVIHMESFWRVGKLSLKITIARDPYDFQSFAIIHKMTETGWKTVAGLPFSQMASMKCSPYDRAAQNPATIESFTRPNFSTDEKTLLDLAEAILL